jgi:hypothetical protein
MMENGRTQRQPLVFTTWKFDESSIEVYTSAGYLAIRGTTAPHQQAVYRKRRVSVEGDIWAMELLDGRLKKGAGRFFSSLFM